VICQKTVWFFQLRDGPLLPHLKTVHRFPDMMTKLRVDTGGIKFVLKGANVMCRGLTSLGGDCSPELAKESPCAVTAQGKQHAMAVGLTKLSTADIRRVNDGIAIDTIHMIGDGLWKLEKIE